MQNELDKIGTTIRINFKELVIDVKILNVKFVFGRYAYLVTPVAGTGETWVDNRTIYQNKKAA